jgi:hypothetical protein
MHYGVSFNNTPDIRQLITLTELGRQQDETGQTCSTHGKDEKCIQYFGRKT